MSDNNSGSRETSTGSIDEDTVALGGFMEGPFVQVGSSPEAEEYLYKLHRAQGSSEFVNVNWRDLWWIDDYPHPGADEPGGNVPNDLGQRTIWVRPELELSANVGSFLAGEIVGDYLPGDNTSSSLLEWTEEAQRRAAMGTDDKLRMSSKPPCLCTTVETAIKIAASDKDQSADTSA